MASTAPSTPRVIKPAPYTNKSPRKYYTMPASYGEDNKDQPSPTAPMVRDHPSCICVLIALQESSFFSRNSHYRHASVTKSDRLALRCTGLRKARILHAHLFLFFPRRSHRSSKMLRLLPLVAAPLPRKDSMSCGATQRTSKGNRRRKESA